MVASPGDVQPERDALGLLVDELNRHVAKERGLRVELLRWETEAYPGFHMDGPQGLIDPVLNIEDCDLLIGIFWKRFGTPTKDARSGTEHEILLAYESWRRNYRPQIMVYFNQEPFTPNSPAEAEQLREVLEFKQRFPKEGLWWSYEGREDFTSKARQHLTKWLVDTFPPAADHIGQSPAPRNRAGVTARNPSELREIYRSTLRHNVGQVRLFGSDRAHALGEVFVTLSIVEEYKGLPSDRRLMGLMDAGLRQKLSLFTYDDDESGGARGGGTRTVTPADLLRGGRQAVVTGAPGCGKTTLLKYLALQIHSNEPDRWVIFLELKTVHPEDLKAAHNNLTELVFAKAIAEPLNLNEAERETLRAEFLGQLRSGKATFLLDGLDEVSHQALFGDLCVAVSEFTRDGRFGHNTLILSARPFALHRAQLEGLEQIEIQPLEPGQIEAFLRNYYPDDESVRGLARALERPGDLRELARVPVMLAAIVELYKGKEAPVETERRLDIYERITRRLVVKLDREKNAQRYSFRLADPEGTIKQDFLQRLAFERLLLDKNDSDTEASRFIFSAEDLLDKAKAFVRSEGLRDVTPHTLADDAKATPLLREVGEDRYAFAHTTLQEYLAAKTLARHQDRERILCRAYFNPTMVEQEVLPMTLGQARLADELYEALERLPESLTMTNLRLRLRGLGYAADISQARFASLLDRTKQILMDPPEGEEPYLRVILKSLSFLTSRARQYLEEKIIPHLAEWSTIDKMRASEALEVVGSEKSFNPLLQVLDPDASQDGLIPRRISAFSSLASDLTHAVCRALVRIDPQMAVPVLGAVSTWYSYGSIDWMLRRVGTEEAHRAILARRTKGMDWRSTEAAKTLLRQSEREGQKVGDVLLAALNHRDDEIRGMAVEVLGTIGSEAFVSPITGCLRDSHPPVRWKAAHALEQIAHAVGRAGLEQAVRPLIEALRDRDSTVRWSAARTLGVIGSEMAVEPLIASLKDPYIEVKDTAASSLGWMGDDRAVEPLIELLSEVASKPRVAAAYALGRFKGKKVAEALTWHLTDPDPQVCAGAASSLGRIGSEEVLDLLIEHLTDDAPEARRGAIRGLGRIGSEKAVPHLLNSLSTDPDEKVRETVLEALGEIGSVETVQPLVEANAILFVRHYAAQALAQVSARTLALALPRLLLHENPFVRVKAARTAGYYCEGTDLLGEFYRLAESDHNGDVRAAAKEARESYEYKLELLKERAM